MVNKKRVEGKLHLLITDGPWWSSELDRNEYRVKQFKKRSPALYEQHSTRIIIDLEKLKRDVDAIINGKTA